MDIAPTPASTLPSAVVSQRLLSRFQLLHKSTTASPQSLSAVILQKALSFVVHAYNASIMCDNPSDSCLDMGTPEILLASPDLQTRAIIHALLTEVIVANPMTTGILERQHSYEIAYLLAAIHELADAVEPAAVSPIVDYKTLLNNFSPYNLSILLATLGRRLIGIQQIHQLPAAQQRQVLDDIPRLYAPLCHRLDLTHIQAVLEDLHLKFTNRTEHDGILSYIQQKRATKPGFLAHFIGPIAAGLRRTNLAYRVQGRTKSIASIYKKMMSQDVALEEMHDLYGVRIIFEGRTGHEHADCWHLYEMITRHYRPNLHRVRDWLTYPKPSGYEALHVTVVTPEGQSVEVQIRSKRMDHKANYGGAAHWRYKSNHAVAREMAALHESWIESAKRCLSYYQKYKDASVTIATNYLYVQ